MSLKESTPNSFRVVFKQSAYDEFKRLDNSVKLKVAAQLLKIQGNPLVGEALGNKFGIDLTGLRRIYVDNRRLRIIWEVQWDRVIVLVFGIGSRDKEEIYKLVARRFKEKECQPHNPRGGPA